jgi:biotin operon repressor
MYLYLLKIGYENNRDDFQISDVAISQELGLTRKTVKSTKEKLKSLGLIQFQTKNGLPCNYRLIADYPLQISEPKNGIDNELEAEQPIQKTEDSAIPNPSFSSTQNIPSLEKFMEYAKTLENYEPQLDSEIQSKYENWKNNGWKNSTDRPITNWKSTLKSTLPYMKNTTESHQFSIQKIPNIKRPKSPNDN